MKILIITLCTILISITVFSQNTIRGKVTDMQSGEALNGATIKSEKAITLTNSQGEFELIPGADIDSITINHTGYKTQKLKVTNTYMFVL